MTTTTDVRAGANALPTLARTEAVLYARDPVNLALIVLLPTVILAALGAVPALREPGDLFGGGTFLDVYAPSLLAISIAVLGVQTLPTTLVGYREKGILRRLSTTPMRPAAVLVVHLLINLVVAAAATLVMVAVAALVFDVPLPRHPVGFVLAWFVGTSAAFALGLVLAALAPRASVAAGVGVLCGLVIQFLSGVQLPKFLLPDLVVRIGEFVPPGTTAIQAAWTGDGPQPLPLVVMAAIAVLGAGVAARLFRWE